MNPEGNLAGPDKYHAKPGDYFVPTPRKRGDLGPLRTLSVLNASAADAEAISLVDAIHTAPIGSVVDGFRILTRIQDETVVCPAEAMDRATDQLRDLLAAITCNDRETAIDAATDIANSIRAGHPLPTVELLGPADCYKPDAERIRVAV
jgi:hypothetical protein